MALVTHCFVESTENDTVLRIKQSNDPQKVLIGIDGSYHEFFANEIVEAVGRVTPQHSIMSVPSIPGGYNHLYQPGDAITL